MASYADLVAARKSASSKTPNSVKPEPSTPVGSSYKDLLAAKANKGKPVPKETPIAPGPRLPVKSAVKSKLPESQISAPTGEPKISLSGYDTARDAIVTTLAKMQRSGAEGKGDFLGGLKTIGSLGQNLLSSVETAAKKTYSAITSLKDSKAGLADKSAAILDAGVSLFNATPEMQVISGLNTIAENKGINLVIPGAKQAAKAANAALGAAQGFIGNLTGKGLDAAVKAGVISPEAEAKIKGPVEEVVGLLGIMVGMHGLHVIGGKAVSGLKDNFAFKDAKATAEPFKATLGIEGKISKKAVDTAYKTKMADLAEEATPESVAKSQMLTTAHTALTDLVEQGAAKFHSVWGDAARYVSKSVPEFARSASEGITEAKTNKNVADALTARNTPIGDTEAGFRTHQDLQGEAKFAYGADAAENFQRIVEAESTKPGTPKINIVNDAEHTVPTATDVKTGEISINPSAVMKLADKLEASGDVLKGETRVQLEERIVREEIGRRKAAMDAISEADQIKLKAALETNDAAAIAEVQRSLNEAPVQGETGQKPSPEGQKPSPEGQKPSPEGQKPSPENLKPSKIGKSIEARAIEKGILRDFGKTAEFEVKTVKDQAARVSDIISNDIKLAKKIVRGEEPLPSGIDPVMFIKGMEEYVDQTGDALAVYELKNSPLVTSSSHAAQTLRFAQERNPDSAMANIAKAEEIKRAANKGVETREKTVVKELKDELKKVVKEKATKQTWEEFINSIQC